MEDKKYNEIPVDDLSGVEIPLMSEIRAQETGGRAIERAEKKE